MGNPLRHFVLHLAWRASLGILLTGVAGGGAAVAFAAERHLLFLGGGGEPEGKSSTIFDESLKGMASYLKGSDWHSDIAFNGGHADTEKILAEEFKKSGSVSSFDEERMNALIDGYEKKILSGEIASGQQVLVMVDTHGAESTDSRIKTHQIAAGPAKEKLDLSNLAGARSRPSLDRLSRLSDLARSKGIRLGIVDFSCHSGSSLALANDNTCVIAASGPHHFAYSDFAENFEKNMKPGRTLEDVYLETRRDIRGVGARAFPMISSPAGRWVSSTYYPAFTPFLYASEDRPQDSDKLTRHLLERGSNPAVCESKSDLELLADQIEEFRKLNSRVNAESAPDSSRLLQLAGQYQKLQDSLVSSLRSWGTEDLKRNEEFVGESVYRVRGHKPRKVRDSTHFTWAAMIAMDPDQVIRGYSDYALSPKTSKTPFEQAQARAVLNGLEKMKIRRAEILAAHPQLADYGNKFRELVSQQKAAQELATSIGEEEKKLYQSLYEGASKENHGPNPCKDIIF